MTGQEWAELAHRRLCQVAELAGEYGVLAEQTGNGDLAALVFQLGLVVCGDQAVDAWPAGQVSVEEDIAATWIPLPGGGVRFLP